MPPAENDTQLRLARALGAGYEVRSLVGRGGFAEVYEVWDRELERRLAIKVLRPDIAWTSGMLARFKQETRTVAKLQHPNILPIHFVGEGEGLVYYAMPYIEGQSLGDLLRDGGPLAPERALAVAIPVLEALHHAHEQGLIHRDIKPDNIMLDTTTGRPLLVDFGIAKRLDGAGGLTQTGFVVGTPYYMSPEQALGQSDLDARSDLYSFGAVLFQMVTGSPPFEGESSQEIVGKHLADPPPLPSDINARVPLWFSNVVTRCLEKRPGDRFQSAAMVLDALRTGRASGAVDAPVASRRGMVAGVDTAAQTELVPSGQRPAAEPPQRRRRPVRILIWASPILVLIAAVAFRITTPRLVFENHLLAPVRVTVAGKERFVPPESRVTLRLPRGQQTDVLWTLVRPLNDQNRPLGAEVYGAHTLTVTSGKVLRRATASPGERAYFAPLITNDTGRPLTVTVNAGTGAAVRCDCTVPPGAVRSPIGYYPLFGNSTVRVEDQLGRSAIFRNLGSEADRHTGVVRLRFEARDLK